MALRIESKEKIRFMRTMRATMTLVEAASFWLGFWLRSSKVSMWKISRVAV